MSLPFNSMVGAKNVMELEQRTDMASQCLVEIATENKAYVLSVSEEQLIISLVDLAKNVKEEGGKREMVIEAPAVVQAIMIGKKEDMDMDMVVMDLIKEDSTKEVKDLTKEDKVSIKEDKDLTKEDRALIRVDSTKEGKDNGDSS